MAGTSASVRNRRRIAAPTSPSTGNSIGAKVLGGGGGGALFADQVDDLVHDPVDVEVLRRVDPGDAAVAQLLRVGRRDDPADHDRDVNALLAQQPDRLGDQLEM